LLETAVILFSSLARNQVETFRPGCSFYQPADTDTGRSSYVHACIDATTHALIARLPAELVVAGCLFTSTSQRTAACHPHPPQETSQRSPWMPGPYTC